MCVHIHILISGLYIYLDQVCTTAYNALSLPAHIRDEYASKETYKRDLYTLKETYIRDEYASKELSADVRLHTANKVHMCIFIHQIQPTCVHAYIRIALKFALLHTGLPRRVGCLKSQLIFRKRATKYRALLE